MCRPSSHNNAWHNLEFHAVATLVATQVHAHLTLVRVKPVERACDERGEPTSDRRGVDPADELFFTEAEVDDGAPAHGKRTPLPFFTDNIGATVTLFTGAVGSEAWHTPKTIPASWAAAGPTLDGLRNYIGNPSLPAPHNVGPGLGTEGPGGVPAFDDLLIAVPDVTPLRATGLKLLEGRTVCAVLLESSVSSNYMPQTGGLEGLYQGTLAFEVLEVTDSVPPLSDPALPKVKIKVLDPTVACELESQLFTEAPDLVDSSNPNDWSVAPGVP